MIIETTQPAVIFTLEFTPGQKVWIMLSDKPTEIEVHHVELAKEIHRPGSLHRALTTEIYHLGEGQLPTGGYIPQDFIKKSKSHIFPTKEALLASL